MNDSRTLYLSDDQKMIWAEAWTYFPGEKLNQVIQRTLENLFTSSSDRNTNRFYEVRRVDAPYVFDTLLKLQNSGLANRYIEAVEEDEIREVLRVEMCLFEALMSSIQYLLDVLLRLLKGSFEAKPQSDSRPSLVIPAEPEPVAYVPTWKQHQIEHDGPSL